MCHVAQARQCSASAHMHAASCRHAWPQQLCTIYIGKGLVEDICGLFDLMLVSKRGMVRLLFASAEQTMLLRMQLGSCAGWQLELLGTVYVEVCSG